MIHFECELFAIRSRCLFENRLSHLLFELAESIGDPNSFRNFVTGHKVCQRKFRVYQCSFLLPLRRFIEPVIERGVTDVDSSSEFIGCLCAGGCADQKECDKKCLHFCRTVLLRRMLHLPCFCGDPHITCIGGSRVDGYAASDHAGVLAQREGVTRRKSDGDRGRSWRGGHSARGRRQGSSGFKAGQSRFEVTDRERSSPDVRIQSSK